MKILSHVVKMIVLISSFHLTTCQIEPKIEPDLPKLLTPNPLGLCLKDSQNQERFWNYAILFL
jgi:hypothetical protein